MTKRDGPLGVLTHVGIDVSDLERSEAFYSELLVLKRYLAREQYIYFEPFESGLVFYLQRVSEGKSSKTRVHIDVDVRDLPEALARVNALGGEVIESYSEWQGNWTVVRDPDGNELCLAQVNELRIAQD